jgi:hypothetical protein
LVFELDRYLYEHLSKVIKEVISDGDHQYNSYVSVVDFHCDKRVTDAKSWQGRFDDDCFNSANFLLLIISPDYLASAYCRRQMDRALLRFEEGTAKAIPIILRSVEWNAPSRLTSLPINGQPVENWPNRYDAFADILEGILQAIPTEIRENWEDPPVFLAG